ncbi:MAG: surface-adhesin E family protein [Burkholderiaceae bacterium]
MSQSVFAEWMFLGATADGTAYLIDPASIKNRGQLVEMLTMQNLRAARKVNGSEFRSAIGHTLYNCTDKTSATTAIRQFSGERGAGKVVGSFKQKPKEIIWDAILPNTIMEKEWRVACRLG